MTPDHLAVLTAIAHGSQPTLDALTMWAAYEGGTAQYNPLNTEFRMPGSWNYNAAGVQSYPSLDAGIRATLATLGNGLFPDVIAAITKNLTLQEWANDPLVAIQIDRWGTHGFADYLRAHAGAPPEEGQLSAFKNDDDERRFLIRQIYMDVLVREIETESELDGWVTVATNDGMDAVRAQITDSVEGQKVTAAKRKTLGLE